MPNLSACVALTALLFPAGFQTKPTEDDDKLDQSGLPVLTAAVKEFAKPGAKEIWARRGILSAGSPEPEFEGALQIITDGKKVRVNYGDYWGDGAFTYVNDAVSTMLISQTGSVVLRKAPESFALPAAREPADGNGGVLLQLLAGEAGFKHWIRMDREITLTTEAGTQVVGLMHQRTGNIQIRIKQGKISSVTYLRQGGGGGGFQAGTTRDDVSVIRPLKSIAKETFSVTPPKGLSITDQRSGS